MPEPPTPKVLIVDDEHDIRLSLGMLLEAEGYQVSFAAGGEAAIQALDGGLGADALLLDYRMPGLNGGQTLDALRARGHRMPAILVTAARDAAEIAARHGFDGVLTKPVGAEQIFSTLRDADRRRRRKGVLMRFVSPSPPLDAQTLRASWDEFLRSGQIHPEHVRPFVARAWTRSCAAGCDPRQARADVLTAEETIKLIRGQARLVEVATPFLAALSHAAGQERHAAMLGDADGRVLKIAGDAQTVADENFPRAGSLLSEEVAGANGIGTALAEGGYVELVGPEHFIEGFHVFTCQGVPLAGSDGRPIGVLSMSVRRAEAASRVRDILFCASEAAECELLSQHLADTIAAPAPLQEMAEKLRQDVVQRLAMARLQFELAARQIARSGSASETLQAAQELVSKFRRNAAVWRNLVAHGPQSVEPIALTELVEDFLGLLATEARVAQIRLVWARAERCTVLDDARALSQRLLGLFIGAIQSAKPGSELPVEVVRAEGVAVVTVYWPDSAGPLAGPSLTVPLVN